MRSISGKRAVITGAASGIGRAIALELAKSGCHTCLLDINEAGLAETMLAARQFDAEVIRFKCNVGDKNDTGKALTQMLAAWPEIDILVNNAGVAYRGHSAEMSAGDWEKLLDVNLRGPIQICQRLLPVLLSRPEAHVLNVCSVLGLCGAEKFAAYSASKFGLVGYSESLRLEYLRSQLGVTAVCPGFVRTPFIQSVPGPGGVQNEKPVPSWVGTTPEVVARKAVKAIRRNRGLVVVTPLAHVLWRLKRFVPGLAELPRLLPTRRIDPPASAGVAADVPAEQRAA